ncbi:hypothetical protein LTS10_002981 [Elasticomyces elasticus]|nr:hypothetical protein LTS10_002981 [Elasticomyces elasticus]
MAKRKADQATITEATMPTPKKAQRRLKVLSTSKLSSKQQNMRVPRDSNYDTNATTSPLLKLPPEIRNRIWGFLFGGKTVHVHFECPSHRMVHFICQVPNDDEDTAEYITHHNELHGSPDRFKTYWTRHEHNEFSCSPEDLGRFLQSLFQSQARAIESITLHCRRPYRTITLGKLVKARLKALKVLTCFVEMSNAMNHPILHAAWTECFSQFEAMAATSATIVPYVTGLGVADSMAPSRATMREWATSFSRTMVVAQD